MKIDQIYEEFTSSIDLSNTRVARFPSLIFLCGGEISTNGEQFKSCRDIFYRYIIRNNYPFRKNIILAEQVFSYFDHSSYQDLLRFERDLAELSVLTVLFSESPGSIAELGSFSVLKPVQERLLVVMHKDDAYQKSFIWRGPALHLKELAKVNGKDDPITVYNWQKKSGKEDILTEQDFSIAEDLAEVIETILSKFPKTESFKKAQLGHVMLLMLDLLKVIQLATLEEIIHLLNLTGINYDRRTVEQHLSLLLSLKLASREPYRNNVYYLSSPHEPWLSWAFAKTAKIRDVDRWKLRFIDHYTQYQIQKSRALRSYMRSTGQIGE